MTRTMTRDFD